MGMDWLLLFVCVLSQLFNHGTEAFSAREKVIYKNKVQEMFSHAFHSYMDHAYPADELMPLSCKGRVRGRDRSRGDIDDALGMFSLTLVDSLDTLAVLGRVDEFNSAIRTIIRDVSFDRDVVVSVFETNIRVLGGLLGGHFAAESLKESHPQLSWYKGHLLQKAVEVGRRLLPAFNTSTGLPYPKVNLRHGMGYHNSEKTTCTACAGTLLMEFAALSRLTGDPEYELKAHHAMDVLWQSRHHGHNLLGSVINVHNGEWTRRDSGVGAGSDSYYEYVLKSYILLGDEEYLKRFQMHYGAIKKYISNGPMLVDVSMNAPTRMTRSYMDSLLAFWPGLQVLWGDVEAAIQTHDMLYHVTEKHNFLPEAFTMDFRVHWGNHPLRPEFSESTYFLYKATEDPYYLDVGKTIVDNLNEYARVSCGFAAIKDLRNNEHEDRMDSFVLAETFKYLFLLFAEKEDVPLALDDFIFTTEAHLFPLSLASVNTTARQVIRDAQVVMRTTPTQTPHPQPSQSPPPHPSQSPPNSNASVPADSSRVKSDQPTCNATPQSTTSENATPLLQPPHPPLSDPSSVPLPQDQDTRTVLTIEQLQCPNDYRPFVLQDQFQKLVLKQCTSSRFRIRPSIKKVTPPRLDVRTLDFSSSEHIKILSELGIVVESLGNGKVQVSHVMQKAKTPEDAEEGWYLMQDIMKLMSEQKKMQEEAAVKMKRSSCLVKIVNPIPEDQPTFEAGPALFGPSLGKDIADITGELHVLSGMDGSGMGTGCDMFSEEELVNSEEKIVMMARGGCLFIQKVRNAQKAGATGAIIADNINLTSDPASPTKAGIPFSMSGDGVEDVKIPSVFMKKLDANILHSLLLETGEVEVELMAAEEQHWDQSTGGDMAGNSNEEDKKEMERKEDHEKELEGDEQQSDEVKILSKKVQSLLEGINTDVLPDELRESVSRELDKLKELNLDPNGGSGSCAAVSKDDLKQTVLDQLNTLQELQSGKPLRIAQDTQPGASSITDEKKTHGEQSEMTSSSEERTIQGVSEERTVLKPSEDKGDEPECAGSGVGSSNHDTCTVASQSASDPGPG